MSRFEIAQLPLEGAYLVTRLPLGDDRGFLERVYCDQDLAPCLGKRTVRQINRTLTRQKGTVRGLHFQLPPHAETKVVSCLRGTIFDVAVDLRTDSPTFLHWHGETLSAENHRSLVIPEGFAHGFQTLTADCELLYLHTAAYAPAAERGFRATDSRLAIEWPLPIAQLSARDAAHPEIDANYSGVSL